jgi:hypothetical protein
MVSHDAPVAESRPVRAAELRPEPREVSPPPAPAVLAPAVTFHPVSEHDAAVEEAHKPVRRRRPGQDGSPAQAELQMVETQSSAPAPQVAEEDGVPARTKPRRRRGGQAPAEPLMLVETRPGEGSQPDSPA